MAESSDASSPLVDSVSESTRDDHTTSRSNVLPVAPSVWAVVRLLVVQMLERVAFVAITFNIAVYIEAYMSLDLAASTPSLIPVANLAMATMRVLAPFYGLLSDAKVGQFKILIGCFTTYCLGACLICGSAFALNDEGKQETLPKALYYPGLVAVLLSAAGIRATLIPFMLEQLSGDEHQRNRYLTPFVSWSYFAMNVGSEIAVLLGGCLQRLPQCRSLRQGTSFHGLRWRYTLPVCSLCLALFILVISRNKFRRNSPSHFYKPSVKLILQAAFCGKSKRQHYDTETLRFYEHEAHDDDKRMEQKKKDDISRLADILPLSLAMILYFTIQSQVEDTFVMQGQHLDFGQLMSIHCLIHPADLPTALEPLTVIVVVPVMLFCVKPLYERIVGTPLYVTPRIRWGMILAFSSCAVATFIESYRDNHYKSGWPRQGHYMVHTKIIEVCYSNIPIYSQVPQYVLMGASEVLAIVSFMEFVLSSSPHPFRSTMFGLVYFLSGIGRYIGIVLKIIVIVAGHEKGFFPPFISTNKSVECDVDKEKSYQPYVFFLVLTVLMTINVFFYLIFEYRFHKFIRIARVPRRKTRDQCRHSSY